MARGSDYTKTKERQDRAKREFELNFKKCEITDRAKRHVHTVKGWQPPLEFEAAVASLLPTNQPSHFSLSIC